MTEKLVTKKVDEVISGLATTDRRATIFHGDSLNLLKKMPDESVDFVLTSPPYCIGKEYEDDTDTESFIETHQKVLPEIVRIAKNGASICWQVGSHVKNGAITPLDYLVHEILCKLPNIFLRNRIVWAFGHGLHCSSRFSGRYEVIMWYTKGDNYHFDLDAVRVPQRYPGKRHSKGPNKGEFSGNPKGKNPSDIWDIPNVKANHIEKTGHPCQFPVALAQRLVKALVPTNGIVLDPFAGSSSTGVAAILENRRFLGAEIDKSYVKISKERLVDALNGISKYRPLDREIYIPSQNEKVAMKPEHFWQEISNMNQLDLVD
jgi:adenine-specific DNA-methyltransferase